MKRFLEIENNIKNFIEDYNRNYKKHTDQFKNPSKISFKKNAPNISDNQENKFAFSYDDASYIAHLSNDEDSKNENVFLNSVKSTKIIKSSFKAFNEAKSNTFFSDMEQVSCDKRSLSFNSIDSNLLSPTNELETSNYIKAYFSNAKTAAPLENNGVLTQKHKCKSETDLLTIIQHKNYKYYFDETSLDDSNDYSEFYDDEEIVLESNDTLSFANKKQVRVEMSSERLNVKDKTVTSTPNKFSLRNVVRSSLSTVEEFFSSLSDSPQQLDIYSSSSTLKSKTPHEQTNLGKLSNGSSVCSSLNCKTSWPNTTTNSSSKSSFMGYYLEDFIEMNKSSFSNNGTKSNGKFQFYFFKTILKH